MKKVLLVTFSDNADHQDTLFGMYEEMRKRSGWDAYLLCIKTPKVELQQSDHTWLVDCPERPGVTKKTFNLPLLLSIIHRVRREHFDAIYFESLHTWNLPIMMMSGKTKTYQVIHEVIPHEGDSQVKMVDLMNKAVVKFADTIVLRNKTYIQDMINRYGIGAERVKYLELWRRYPSYTQPVHNGRALFFGRINPYKGADNLLEIVRLCPDIQFDVIGRVDPQMQDVVDQLAQEKNVKLNNDYVNVRHLPRFFDYSTELSYSKTERVTDIEDIQHPAIRNAMKMLDMHEIRLTYEADLPARSGLGTSSSFAVGMLNAFYALKGKYVDKKKLADEAIYLERNLCQEAGGWQDQIAASFGGFNRINFNADGYEVLPVIISPERKRQLNKNLMMFFTGFTRFSSDVQKANASGKQDKTAQLKEMLALVDDAERVLTDKNADLDDFGRMLDHTWRLKRRTGAAVSNNSIDELYAKGIAAGALGGKLLGAGGGGFLVFYVQPDCQDSVRWAMRDLLHIPFAFEDGGTRVIHYTPEMYEPKA